MIELVIDQRRRDLGGFEVGRVLPFAKRRMVGPFVFFDHMGRSTSPPGIPRTVDVRPHPHIGLSTVTYLFDGEIMHRDSVGSEQAIRPGEVNWMTAGRGITHSERFEQRAPQGGAHARHPGLGGAARSEHEETVPAFAHHGAGDLPILRGRRLRARLIAGKAFGAEAEVTTHSPLFYVHWQLDAGAHAAAAGRVSGARRLCRGRCGRGGRPARSTPARCWCSRRARPIAFTAVTPAIVMLLGGEPVGERFIEWNFVSSSKERIEQAKADWRAGRMKLPDLDDHEFIPLPPGPASPQPL